MIFPPTYKRYMTNDHCTVKGTIECPNEFKCGSCDIAWKAYKEDLKENYEEWVLPTTSISKGGVNGFVNIPNSIGKLGGIEDIRTFFPLLEGAEFQTYSSFIMDQEELRELYPYWYALKFLADLGEPKSYKGGRTLPLIVEYDDCVYLVSPVVSGYDE